MSEVNAGIEYELAKLYEEFMPIWNKQTLINLAIIAVEAGYD